MYRMIMDFDRGEMRIPKDVAQALSMPADFGWFVHWSNRQIAITRYRDPDYLLGQKESTIATNSANVVQIQCKYSANTVQRFLGMGVRLYQNKRTLPMLYPRHTLCRGIVFYTRFCLKNASILSNGIASFPPPSYRSVWDAPGTRYNSLFCVYLLSCTMAAKASLPK